MHNYYRIINQTIGESSAEFQVELQEDCPVYAGHFPGNPIAPGACNMEMVRQCASITQGKELRIREMKVCKFLMLLQPHIHKVLTIQINWNDSSCTATILSGDKTAVQLKMILS